MGFTHGFWFLNEPSLAISPEYVFSFTRSSCVVKLYWRILEGTKARTIYQYYANYTTKLEFTPQISPLLSSFSPTWSTLSYLTKLFCLSGCRDSLYEENAITYDKLLVTMHISIVNFLILNNILVPYIMCLFNFGK